MVAKSKELPNVEPRILLSMNSIHHKFGFSRHSFELNQFLHPLVKTEVKTKLIFSAIHNELPSTDRFEFQKMHFSPHKKT